MNNRAPVRGASLAQQTQEILTERIKNGVYAPQSQIPPENELAAEFNISRATIRSAMSALVERGLLVRRHGVGTFVSQRSGLSNPLNEAVDFNHLITNNGFTSGIRHSTPQLLTPSLDMAQQLNIDSTQPVLKEYKVFTADGEPVIYCINIMPTWLFTDELLQEIIVHPEVTEPLYDFLEEQTGQRVDYFIAKIHADIGQNCEFSELIQMPNLPVLVIEEVGHTAQEVPLWYSLEYYPNNNNMSFELVRHRVQG